jgi:hypothetical protein
MRESRGKVSRCTDAPRRPSASATHRRGQLPVASLAARAKARISGDLHVATRIAGQPTPDAPLCRCERIL